MPRDANIITAGNHSKDDLIATIRSISGAQYFPDALAREFRKNSERYRMIDFLAWSSGAGGFRSAELFVMHAYRTEQFMHNSSVFLAEHDVDVAWRNGEMYWDEDEQKYKRAPWNAQSGAYRFGSVELFFPNLKNGNTDRAGVPIFGFLRIPGNIPSGDHLRIFADVHDEFFPAIVLRNDLIWGLNNLGGDNTTRFLDAMRTVINVTNHDYAHRYTQGTFKVGGAYKSDRCMDGIINPDLDRNGLSVEEVVVLELNKAVFDGLRTQKSPAIEEFYSAVGTIGSIADSLQPSSSGAYKNARSLIRYYLGFLFDKSILKTSETAKWADIVRDNATRQDLRLLEIKPYNPNEIIPIAYRVNPITLEPIPPPSRDPLSQEALSQACDVWRRAWDQYPAARVDVGALLRRLAIAGNIDWRNLTWRKEDFHAMADTIGRRVHPDRRSGRNYREDAIRKFQF